MTRPTVSQSVGVGLLAIAAVRVVSELRSVLVVPVSELVRRTPDDTWYYLTVARNVAAGHGVSFDGRERTNGFQPLWQGTVAALATVWHGTASVRATLVVAGLFTVAAVVLIVAVASRVLHFGLVGTGLVAVVVTSPPVWARLCDGMETPTVLLSVAALMVAVAWWWRRPTPGRFAMVGAASGLCCLARTSTLLVVVLVPVLLLAGHPSTPRSLRAIVTSLAAWVASVSVVVSSWLVWTWVAVGSPVQVSSRVKWQWSQEASGAIVSAHRFRLVRAAVNEELWRQVRLGLGVGSDWPSAIRRALELGVVVLVVWLVVRSLRRSRQGLIVLVPAALVLARVLAEMVALPTLVSSWYAAPLLVVSAVAAAATVGAAAGWVRARFGRSRAGAVGMVGLALGTVAVAVAVAFLPAGRPSGTWGLANLDAGRELARLGGRAGAFDAGVVGWVHAGTVNLDGLMRSPRSVDRLLRTPPGRVAIDDGVDLLVGRMTRDDPRLPDCARRLWASTRLVRLPGQGARPVGIWSLRDCER